MLELLGPVLFALGYTYDPETGARGPAALLQVPSPTNGGIVDNGDGTVSVTYQIAPGATWSDGVPMSGADLAFTYELISDPDVAIRSDIRSRYSGILPGSVLADGSKVTFDMEPGPSVGALFDVIVPRHDVEGSEFAEDWNDRLWVSAGPFSLGAYEPGQFLEVVRTDREDDLDLPGTPLERIVFRFFDLDGNNPDPRLLEGVRSGAIDLAVFDDADGRAGLLDDLQSNGLRIVTVASPEWEHLNFQFGPNNRNDESLNQHLEFRRAVAHAIDREELAATFGAPSVTSVSGLFAVPGTSNPWAAYSGDVGEVKSALFELEQALGTNLLTGDGPRLVLSTSDGDATRADLAGEIVRMLRDAGLDAELQLEDRSLLFGETLDNGSWDVGLWSFGSYPGVDGAAAFYSIFDPEGLPFVGSNYFRWGTLDSLVESDTTIRYAQLVDAIERTADADELAGLLAEAESILAEELVILPLVHRDVEGAAWWDSAVEGIAVHPWAPVTWNIASWRQPAA